MELLRRFWDAAIALDPAAAKLDEGGRFLICNPDALEKLFREAGLGDVRTGNLDQPVVFRDFDEYWAPFLGGQGPSGGYTMSLSEGKRARLRERLQDGLPRNPDGSIRLTLRAWVVRGVRP